MHCGSVAACSTTCQACDVSPFTGTPGITLYTSEDGGTNFKAACLPVALRVRGAVAFYALALFTVTAAAVQGMV